MKKIAILYFILLNTLLGFSQTEPQLFEPGLISNNGVFGFTLSPNSEIALWVSSNGKRDTLKIMESKKVGENGQILKWLHFHRLMVNGKTLIQYFHQTEKQFFSNQIEILEELQQETTLIFGL